MPSDAPNATAPRTEPVTRLGAQPSLNGLRGVAILLVFAYHSFPDTFGGGFLGVDLFFVLSGFLITSLLLEEDADTGRISYRAFWIRRGLRLFPALLVALLVVLVVGLITTPDESNAILIFVGSTALDVANIAVWLNQPTYAAHTWSLSAEEQFYFVWPLVLMGGLALVGLRRYVRWIVMGVMFLAIAVVVEVRAHVWQTTHDWIHLYYSPFLHTDGLLAGCTLALARGWGMLRVPRSMICSVVGLVGVVAFVYAATQVDIVGGFLYSGGYLVAIGAACLAVFAAASSPRGILLGWLRFPPLVYVGRISYALYIWSNLVLWFFRGDVPTRLAGVAVSLAIASLSFYIVERPALRLKARYSATRKLARVVVEPAAAVGVG
jgi:peptidoglycan/LPS O-acetylase OafA/YrhL